MPNSKCDVDDIDPRACTHLLYAFAGLDANGALKVLDPWMDLPNNGGRNSMQRFNNLRNQNPSLKTLIAIGGAKVDASIFSSVAANAHLRTTFAENARRFCQTHGFNGVDIDWEFPDAYDRDNFVQMLATLASELHSHGLILTTSVGPSASRASKSYNIPGIARHVDYILLMAYDYNGSWSGYTGHNAPLYPSSSDQNDFQRELNIDHSVQYWTNQGAPSHKLILGLAAYGRTFTLSHAGKSGFRAPTSGAGRAGPFTAEPGILAYYEVGDAFSNRQWDAEQCVPYAVAGDQWIGYDDKQSIKKKCEYINRQGLGGAMVWSIEMDERRGGLLQTINQCL